MTREEAEFCSRFLIFFPPFTNRLCSQSKASGNIFEVLSCISCIGFAAELQPHWLYCSMKNADSTPCINPKWKRAPGLRIVTDHFHARRVCSVMSSDWRHLKQKNDSLAWWGPFSICAQISWPLELEELVI